MADILQVGNIINYYDLILLPWFQAAQGARLLSFPGNLIEINMFIMDLLYTYSLICNNCK